jgi:hypothetical protein
MAQTTCGTVAYSLLDPFSFLNQEHDAPSPLSSSRIRHEAIFPLRSDRILVELLPTPTRLLHREFFVGLVVSWMRWEKEQTEGADCETTRKLQLTK